MAFTILSVMKWSIPLLMITGHVFADDCPSRHYCHTPEIKYRAFNELPGAYLNSTDKIMKTVAANTTRKCMLECTHTPNCQSANYYQKGNASEMSCDLIQGNKWSNASLLVKRDNSTHYFVMNSCASNPCKHGGTCISLDQEASYKCACVPGNLTTTIHGALCETVKLAENTSAFYMDFNSATPRNLQNEGQRFYKTGNAKVINVPDRGGTNSALYLPGESGSYGYISGLGSECPMRIDNCQSSPNDGLTVSLWFRLLQRTQKRFSTSSCSSVSIHLVESTIAISSYQGFRIRMNGCTQNAIQVEVRDYSQLWQVSWGNSSLESWSKQWQNLAFTYHSSRGIVLYFNAQEVARQQSASGQSAVTNYYSYIVTGKTYQGKFETYIDDFTFWKSTLPPAEIIFNYQIMRARNPSGYDE